MAFREQFLHAFTASMALSMFQIRETGTTYDFSIPELSYRNHFVVEV